MTKQELAKAIVEHCDTTAFMDEDPIPGILAYLAPLTPEDRGSFARWGHKDQQSTEEECWP